MSNGLKRWPGWIVAFVCLTLASWPLLPRHARAQAQAHDELAKAERAYAAGRLEAALEAFENAYADDADPRTLYRVGDTADKLGRHTRAVSALREYLALVPEAKDRAFIEARIRSNRLALGLASTQPSSATPVLERHEHTRSVRAHKHDERGAGPWWLWVGAGAAVVIGVTIAAVALSAPAQNTPEPVRGNLGQTVQTLSWP